MNMTRTNHDTPQAVILIAQQTAFIKNIQVSAFVLLSYDHVTTLAREIRLIWRWPLPILSIAFLLNRYFAVVVNVFELYPYFISPPLSPQSCIPIGIVRMVSIIPSQLGLWGSQLWRVSALHGHSKKFICKMVLLFGILMGFNVWTLKATMTRVHLEPNYIGCSAILQPPSAYWAGITWIVFSLWEVIMICLISFKTWGPATTIKAITGQNLLSTILFRDGVIYFVAVAVSFMANALTFFIDSPYLVPGAFSWTAASISVTMTSRFLLNIKEHLNSRVNGDGYTSIDIDLSNIIFRQLGNLEPEHEDQELEY